MKPATKDHAFESEQLRGGIQTFTYFSKLPTELQHKIWDIYLESPQVVAIEVHEVS